MNTVIDFIQNNDVTIMIGLLILIIMLTIVVIITDYINRKKNKIDAAKLFEDENSNLIHAFNEKMNEEANLDYTVDLGQYTGILNLGELSNNNNNNIHEIKYVEENEELEKTKAKIELQELKEDLMKIEQENIIEETIKSTEKIEKIEENINTIKEIIDNDIEIIDLDEEPVSFEAEQEENAIISLDEFCKISDKVYDQNEITQYKDEGNEPISIQELEELYNTKEIKDLIQENNEQKIESEKNNETNKPLSEGYQGYKKSPVISPIYGINENVEENVEAMRLENTANLEKLNEEIKKTNEFLNTLRELRKNLQ